MLTFSKYADYHSASCYGLTVIPTILIRREYDYKKGSYGVKLDQNVLIVSVSWLFWAYKARYVWGK